MNESAEYDVAIIGLGPVGSLAAILFAHAGLKVVVFEKDHRFMHCQERLI